jgi:phage tail sheath gpL-like
MGTISTAVGVERLSKTTGYAIQRGKFNNDTPYLPQVIAILGEANTANQSGLTVDPVEVTSANEAGELFGFGSPIHSVMRILRPISGDGVGGIPTIVYPQISAGGASATVRAWTVTGTATANTTHTVVVNGRTGLDFKSYEYSVAVGDTPTVIAGKIKDVINGITNAPCTATNALGVVTITSKWEGATSAELNISFDLGTKTAGISYSQTTSTDGAGTVDLADTLALFSDEWNTIVINTYGEAQFATLEAFNGIPNDVNPTGRYSGLIFKPFMAYAGSTLSDKDDLATITNDADRISEVTNVLCVAPNSKNFTYEIASNVVLGLAPILQNQPHLDESAIVYADVSLPSDGNIGDMKDYNNRDFLLKKGCSTVMVKKGQLAVQDLVTTYHPEGEVPLQYNYVRNLNIDFNVAFKYKLLEELYLTGKTIVSDDQLVTVANCIKPIEWKGIVFGLFDDLAEIGLIVDPEFSKASVVVNISTINPNRFETTFSYKRTGTVRIASTTAKAGF